MFWSLGKAIDKLRNVVDNQSYHITEEIKMGTAELEKTSIAGFPALRSQGRTDRPLLLFLHGAFVTHEPFNGYMRVLAQAGWRSVAVSRRGRLGVAPERALGLRIADYLEDTLKVLDALGEKPVVVGHSLGGLLAQQVAELDRCKGAVLLAPAPAAMLTAQNVALPTYLPMFPKILLGRPLLPTRGGCAVIALNQIPEVDRPAIHNQLIHESGKVYREMIFGSIRVDPARVKCPMLVIGGRQDRIVSEKLVRVTAERYGAELVMLDDHAHWLLEEPNWEKIAERIGEWLDRSLIRRGASGSSTVASA